MRLLALAGPQNADNQYAAGGAPVQQPVVGFNCSAANCVLDGLVISGSEIGDPTKVISSKLCAPPTLMYET